MLIFKPQAIRKTDWGIQIYSGVLLHLVFPLEPMAIKANGEMNKKTFRSQLTVHSLN